MGSTPITLAVRPPIVMAPPLTVRTARTPLILRILATSACGMPLRMTASTSGTTSWRGSWVSEVVRTVGVGAAFWLCAGRVTAPNGTPMMAGPPTLAWPIPVPVTTANEATAAQTDSQRQVTFPTIRQPYPAIRAGAAPHPAARSVGRRRFRGNYGRFRAIPRAILRQSSGTSDDDPRRCRGDCGRCRGELRAAAETIPGAAETIAALPRRIAGGCRDDPGSLLLPGGQRPPLPPVSSRCWCGSSVPGAAG